MFGLGGGNIKRKSIIVVLMLLGLALPLSMSTVSAATQNQTNIPDQNLDPDSTGAIIGENVQVQTKQFAAGSNSTSEEVSVSSNLVSVSNDELNDAASGVKTFVDKNHRLPNYVSIADGQVTSPQFLQLLTERVLNINSGQNNSLNIKNVSEPTNPTESVKSGSIQKTEYLQIAQKLIAFTDSNGRLPNYVSSSLGKIRYESLVYMYSKIINFQDTNNRLPSTVSVTTWTSQSEGTISDSSLVKYLQPTANCQSTSSTIKSLATSITAGTTSNYNKAVKIFNWVRDNVTYSYYNNTRKGALGTLSSRSGNCCDHSHLVIALSRAAGIPGRYIHIYGHVYSQLYVDGKWYNADAINNNNYFGQSKSTSNILGTYAELPF